VPADGKWRREERQCNNQPDKREAMCNNQPDERLERGGRQPCNVRRGHATAMRDGGVGGRRNNQPSSQESKMDL
jgi:hypothetical protein